MPDLLALAAIGRGQRLLWPMLLLLLLEDLLLLLLEGWLLLLMLLVMVGMMVRFVLGTRLAARLARVRIGAIAAVARRSAERD